MARITLTRNQIGWLVLRLALAWLVAAHGYYRFVSGGSADFGVWLNSQGVPFGTQVAWAITIVEMIGSILLTLGRFVFPTTLTLSAIYCIGIFMVHAPEGWFVVGAGRNGAEYSVLLIISLLCVGIQFAPGKKAL